MKAVTSYFACDGKAFETEAECIQYEEDLMNVNKIFMFDNEGDRTSSLEQAMILNVEDIEGRRTLARLFPNTVTPEKTGLSVWSEKYGEWVSLEELKEAAEEFLNHDVNVLLDTGEFEDENLIYFLLELANLC